MKRIISIISGILAAALIFWGMSGLIGLVTSGIQDTDIRGIAKVVCWLFAIGFTIWLAILAGVSTGVIVEDLLKKRRR